MNHFSTKKSFLLYALSLLVITSSDIIKASQININTEEEADLQALERKFSCKPPVSSCSNNTTCITSVPFTICQPGLYCLTDNFDLTDSPLACPVAITIQADNVDLSLNGFTLTGGTRGIDIQECSQNVVISKGTIKNTEAEAIRVGKNSSNIIIWSVKAINCNIGNTCDGSAAILFDGTFTDLIKDSFIYRTYVLSSFGTGISLKFCQDCRVVTSNVSGMLNGFNADANGFYSSGNGNYFEHCNAA